jgi:hypothetical protein
VTGPGRPLVGKVREVRVDDETWSEVERYAALGGVSAARWVRDAIAYRFATYQSDSTAVTARAIDHPA